MLDETDPYLVVAADKGTATFSDIANAHRSRVRLLARRRLRLRRLGRLRPQGARDHREGRLGVGEAPLPRARPRRDDASRSRSSGVGDMSGDVFGNGMLLSEQIRLVAAFDHRHVFIDPKPDPEAFAERKRLFELPGSSWDDYDRSKISPGGGVWSRQEKSIPLSPEAQGSAGRERGRRDAERGALGDPQGAGRPPLERRHRHVREGDGRESRRRRRPRERRDPGRRRRPAGAGRRRGRQPRASRSAAASSTRTPVGASTPTSSTTPPASTSPTTRST